MTHENWESLPAQTPPPGFADRVVAAALRERAASRERNERARGGDGARRGARRAALVAIAATLLVGSAAWGFALWARPVSLRPVSAPVASAAGSVAPKAQRASAPLPIDVDAGGERDAAVRLPAQPVIHPLKSLKVADAKVDAGEAGVKVIVPPCECARDEVICTCF